MRMFLVGMCDIFLLLYLTALAQIDARQISDITVKDYIALKTSTDELEKQRRDTEERLRQRELAIAETRRQLASLQESIKKESSERASLARSMEQVKKSEDERRARAAEELRKAKETEQQLQAALGQREKELQRVKVSEEQRRKEVEEARKLAEKRQADLDAAKKKAEEELQEAQRQKLAADRRAEDAEQERERALQIAQTEREVRGKALDYAEKALAKADGVQRYAERAHERAISASEQSERARQKMESVTQSTGRAFAVNVEPRLMLIDLELTSRSLFGSEAKRIALKLVPVRYGNETLLFAPRSQVPIDDIDGFEARVRGERISKVYLGRSGRILGFVVPASREAARAIDRLSPSSLMPTLMAIRNGAKQSPSDRRRKLDESYFPFQRDRLAQEGSSTLRYNAIGDRGTGDFGEQVIPGDQIVDLDGNFVGLAIDGNTVAAVPDLSGWRKVELRSDPGESARQLAD